MVLLIVKLPQSRDNDDKLEILEPDKIVRLADPKLSVVKFKVPPLIGKFEKVYLEAEIFGKLMVAALKSIEALLFISEIFFINILIPPR